ncbi:MAG: hypothetical protein AAGJ46_11885 [Planctomycetota bacterium]
MLTTRGSLILAGALLIFASICSVAVSWFTYVNRWTFFRPVYEAVQSGQDPYQAARVGADRLATDFPLVSAINAVSVGSIAISLLVLAKRQTN